MSPKNRFNSLFGSFLDFVVPLIILGLVAPGIAELGRGAGKMLAVTLLIASAPKLAAFGMAMRLLVNGLYRLVT